MNKVILGGFLGEQPEVRFTPSGQAVLKLRLATNSRYKNTKTDQWETATEWHTVVMWGKRGEALGNMLSSGQYIVVEGELRTRSWDDVKSGAKRYATEVIAKDIETAGKSSGNQSGDYEDNQDPGRRPQNNNRNQERPRQSKGFVPQDYDQDPQTGFGG